MAFYILKPYYVFKAQSMGVTLTSEAVSIAHQDNVGIQLHWTGTPTGDFSVQISSTHEEDASGTVFVPGDWVTLPVSPAIVASGAADDAYIDLNQMSAQWVRVVYTRTSGTGALTAAVVAKGI